MKLSDFLDALSYGELSQYASGTEDSGRIWYKDLPKFITFINAGLLRLYTDLPISQKQVTVQTNVNQTKYLLSSEFALSKEPEGGDEVNRYILDLEDEFEDDIITIEQVVNENEFIFPLNSPDEEFAVFTPGPNRLLIPEPRNELVAVLYRARHKKIPVTRRLDADEYEINVPDYCEDALINYCAYRFVKSGGSAESVNLSNAYLAAYENEVFRIKEAGIITENIYTNTRIWRDSWV
ncbi:MAG: hypothetical protein AXW14_08505 [Alteromonas sp. Nap_26]|nr:MAG: hypothetical protein AXW14_08505 [Alteromonas sp. Nap_26]